MGKKFFNKKTKLNVFDHIRSSPELKVNKNYRVKVKICSS